MDKKISIYNGTGTVLAKDVEIALQKLEIPFDTIDELDIKRGKLKAYSTFIVPGGYTAQYVETLGEEGFNYIKEFVKNGGKYIGICAGAYIASKNVKVKGNPPGLDIIDIKNVRKRGRKIVTIRVVNPNHPIVKDCPKYMKIWYQNGPTMIPGKNVEVIANYKRGGTCIVSSTYGKGKVIIFSVHPEGNIENRIDPAKLGTLKLLKNAILFTLKKPSK